MLSRHAFGFSSQQSIKRCSLAAQDTLVDVALAMCTHRPRHRDARRSLVRRAVRLPVGRVSQHDTLPDNLSAGKLLARSGLRPFPNPAGSDKTTIAINAMLGYFRHSTFVTAQKHRATLATLLEVRPAIHIRPVSNR